MHDLRIYEFQLSSSLFQTFLSGGYSLANRGFIEVDCDETPNTLLGQMGFQLKANIESMNLTVHEPKSARE